MRGALILGGLLLCAAPALGYSAAPPHSFAKPTANGKFVLVMLHELERPAEKGLKEKYGRSGLYPVNDPTKPLWTCDWRADWERNVFASDDGAFAVRVPDHDPGLRHWVLSYQQSIPAKPAGWEDAPALFIYKDGKPFRTITLRDAFDTSRFTDRDCFMGPIVAIESFADDRVVITTEADGREQTASVAFRTGEVTAGSGGGGGLFGGLSPGSGRAGGSPGESESAGGRNWVRVLLIGLAVVAACAGAFAVLLFRNARKRVE